MSAPKRRRSGLATFLIVMLFAVVANAQDSRANTATPVDPWPWICGILATANGIQFWTASKDRQQARQDMMLMLPAITASTLAIEKLKE